ncbi:hypothetical protein A2348_02500 [Candidatus Uhrbacteria bacterium RIFOXYB12_FULL_58_10]|uniref:POTRA domain-containing protein n=1 Tax=Candidatus Uhrbacteria bacterium RIFOXYB2_FULL_57_15 TaxID=1802422 RepID=A0A1F7W7X5_9BACT|nr:MAG: hypothetical protein A2348_02500 [Candidatus Uhrbacteria bacterium RIFOXYB12_FULL_58_10]OGL98194.1 MAG: hypothetical protein A2304_03730 [Candidatus Uhrbacteria bacterium RIFOXYB2_FULL_57_15]OGL99168.1 MAG: hypothetical protein A2501_03145 [Candidatus Uhrbacteria bacterium RIFOXYC12_FULL_57_11]
MRSRNHFRVLQRKRYAAHRFSNPYFRREKKQNWKAIFILSAIILLLLGGVRWIFGAQRFSVTSVRLNGNETISSDQLSGKVWGELNRRRALFFRAGNRFLFDENRLRAALSSAYAFETLNIDLVCEWVGPGECAMSIDVKEKTSQLLWQVGGRVFLADIQGIVIRELTDVELEEWRAADSPSPEPLSDGTILTPTPPNPLKRLPLFVDVNATPIEIGNTVLSKEEVANLFVFHKRLEEMDIPFTQTNIDRLAGKWMAVRTEAGYDILFDAAGDVDAQMRNLVVLLRDTIKDQSTLEYIDLRFGDHVYYK